MIEIKKTDAKTTRIGVEEFKGKKGVNMRDFIKSDSYNGPGKEGIWIPIEKWPEYFEAFKVIDKEVHKLIIAQMEEDDDTL